MVAASPTMNTPSKISKEELHQKLIKALEANGDMPAEEWRKFMTMIVGDIWEHVVKLSEMPARITKLEENSVLLRMKKDKGLATLWISLVALFFYFLHDLLPWLVARITEISGIVK